MSNEQIIEGFKNGDNIIIKKAYKIMQPRIDEHVFSNSGSINNSKDVMRISFERFEKKCQEGRLVLTTDWQNFVYGIVKNVWKEERGKAIRRNEKEMPFSSIEDTRVENSLSTFDMQTMSSRNHDLRELIQLIIQAFTQISELCAQIFELKYVKQMAHKEIAQVLDIKEGTSRKRLKDCLDKLRYIVMKDPRFRDFDDLDLLYKFIFKK